MQAALPGRRKASRRKRTHPSLQGTHCDLVPTYSCIHYIASSFLNLLLFHPLLFSSFLDLSFFSFHVSISPPSLPHSLPPSLPPSLPSSLPSSFPFLPPSSLSPTGSTKRRIEVLTISDIEKEYLLVRAKLRLLLRDQTMTTQLSSKENLP